MKLMKYLIIWFFFLFSKPLLAIPSFPGAEGFGALSKGGRDGDIIFVTNLNDRGAGSFREACDKKGPRIIIFKVGGTIHLKENIVLQHPYVTIAGQTAPGDGICIRNAGISIRTNDIILRGLRIRIGDDPKGPRAEERDGININNPGKAYNIIIDHCSISWAIDENIGTWGKLENLTVQWSIISEGLFESIHTKGPHGMGFLLGAGAKKVTIHHNLLAHNMDRNPFIQGNTQTEIINNVIYNWKWKNSGTILSDTEKDPGPLFCDLISNTYINGIDTDRRSTGITLNDHSTMRGSKVYVKGNISDTRSNDSNDEWLCVTGSRNYYYSSRHVNSKNVTIENAKKSFLSVLENAGAIYPVRDAVDERVIHSVKEKSGRLVNSPNEVDGFPEYWHQEPPKDSDSDGIPDRWEEEFELNPYDNKDAKKTSPEGYNWIEEYINSLIME